MRAGKLTTKELEKLEKGTFSGKEKKSLAYIIGIMNNGTPSTSCRPTYVPRTARAVIEA